jgi:uncharacterized membrane protein YadS
MVTTNRKWTDGMLRTEDWWAVWLGLIMFFAGLMTIWSIDLVGWMTKLKTWEITHLIKDFSWASLLKPVGNTYAEVHPLLSLFMTYIVFTVLTAIGAYFQRLDVKQFIKGFTILFLITWTCWIIGHEAHFKAVDAVGLIIGNIFKGVAHFLKEAAKPEWFIKTAIVYLGIKLGVMSMKATGFVLELALAGAAATFIAYMLFWPIVYTLARRVFKLPRDASAVLSSGISVCGVSASIATAGAIRAKPILPIAVSMLIVIFAMIELVVLPGVYSTFAPNQPIVNGAAMGMTVKTDGADAAAGAILDELMVSQHLSKTGEEWEEGWILSAALLTKIWIDVFIGIWAFLLALIWLYKVEGNSNNTQIGLSEIWFRFPKFVIGYFIAWLTYVAIAVWAPDHIDAAKQGADIVQSPMRKMMFMLTFVSIGVITDFSKLKGMGRLAVLYALALFLIIAPIAYIAAYLFHHGMMPPLATT